MLQSILAICVGASLGATLRWFLGLGLNHVLPQMALGTLVANLAGGFIMGLALCFFSRRADIPPQWTLFVITGFLGSLTTFSAFSGEVVLLMRGGQLLWACATMAAHVAGSLVMTFLGTALCGLAFR